MDFDSTLKKRILSDLDDAERALRSIKAEKGTQNYLNQAKRAVDDAITKVKRADPKDE